MECATKKRRRTLLLPRGNLRPSTVVPRDGNDTRTNQVTKRVSFFFFFLEGNLRIFDVIQRIPTGYVLERFANPNIIIRIRNKSYWARLSKVLFYF